MIVWLASYPRSGNTLLRTVLYQCLGYGSFNDEIDPDVRERVALSESVERTFGHMELPGPWDAFYPDATAAPVPRFVKTHLAPRDSQCAIYVVRDGRSALASYARFHQRFHAWRAKSLIELVLGDDYYGGWSEHYRAWTQRGGETLVVKYEELARASPQLVGRLAQFVGHEGEVREWRNPFERQHEDNPAFFRAGKLAWEGDTAWTAWIDGMFFELHGELMQELGYAAPAEAEKARAALTPGERTLASLVRPLVDEKRALEDVCRERQSVIEELDRACRERLAVIERLSAR